MRPTFGRCHKSQISPSTVDHVDPSVCRYQMLRRICVSVYPTRDPPTGGPRVWKVLTTECACSLPRCGAGTFSHPLFFPHQISCLCPCRNALAPVFVSFVCFILCAALSSKPPAFFLSHVQSCAPLGAVSPSGACMLSWGGGPSTR